MFQVGSFSCKSNNKNLNLHPSLTLMQNQMAKLWIKCVLEWGPMEGGRIHLGKLLIPGRTWWLNAICSYWKSFPTKISLVINSENKHWAACKQSLATMTTSECTASPTTSEPSSSKWPPTSHVVTSTPEPTATTANVHSEDGCHSFTWDKCINDFGDVITFSNEKDPIDCQNLCVGVYQLVGCKTFVFDFHHNNCTLYKKVVNTVSEECKTYGGPKDPTIDYCQPSRCTVSISICSSFIYWVVVRRAFYTFKEFWYSGCEYEGYHLKDYPQIPDAKLCQTVCRDYEKGCNYWVYEFADSMCHTYSNPIMECRMMIGPHDFQVDKCYTPQ